MTGGGLGNFAPGEWSDDTSMALCIAEIAATGADLTSIEALDAIAGGFLRWYDDGPADIGIQTSAVLGADRKSVVSGKSVSVRVAPGGRRIIKKNTPHTRPHNRCPTLTQTTPHAAR